MNRFNQLLVAALAAQVVIAGGIYYGGQPPAADQIQIALLNSEKDQIDRITIDEGDGKQVILSKINGKWQLPDYYQLPAVQHKVDSILNTLQTTKSGWPVATTASSRERFEVSDDSYQKKVVLSQGGNAVQTLYLGTSPGFRQLHVRRSGEDEVYTVKLNSFDFPSQATQWLNKGLLQTKADIASLEGPDYAFERRGETWQLKEGDGEAVVDEIEKVIRTLARLNIQGANEKTPQNVDYELVVKSGGETRTYQFFKVDSEHFVSRDDFSQAFKINKSDFESITGQTATRLVKQVEFKEESSIADSENEKRTQNLNTSNTEKEVMQNENS